ncbi:cyclin-dependent kinase 2 isoform 1 [Aphelenchoides avenae]|nr:cyclin-dependent kinase 2 isoform 1 [Aphelenchus avenae]
MNTNVRHPFEHYTDVKKVGEGTYGTVYKGKRRSDGTLHALKQIVFKESDTEGVPGTCIREICILKELRHPGVVTLLDVVLHKYDKLYLVLEFIDWDLRRLMDAYGTNRALPAKYVKSFMLQLCQALTYCHTHRVIHRDLKPQNLLVTQGGIIKLADFGLAREISVSARCYTHEVVTLWYRAPEVLLGARCYSTAVDMWSLACVFAEMATGRNLFAGDSEIDQLYKIFQVLGTPTPQSWPGVETLTAYQFLFPHWPRCNLFEKVPELGEDGVALLAAMLVYTPMDRFTAKAALCHQYMYDVEVNLPPLPEMLQRN